MIDLLSLSETQYVIKINCRQNPVQNMDNSEIVRKRLVDLKKLSEELKDSSEHDDMPNINLIQAIMSLTKDYSPAHQANSNNNNLDSPTSRNDSVSRLFSLLQMNNKKQSSPSKKSSTKLQRQQNSSNSLGESLIHKLSSVMLSQKDSNKESPTIHKKQIYRQQKNREYAEEEYEPLFPQHQDYRPQHDLIYRVQSYAQNQNYQNLSEEEKQIIHLRELNIELQIEAKKLREEVQYYEMKEEKEKEKRIKKQQQWMKDLPYFKIQETAIPIFMTRLSIHQKDYHKIDYIESKANLSLDKLTISKQPTLKSPKNFNIQQKEEEEQELALDELVAVDYLGDTQGINSSTNNSMLNKSTKKNKKSKPKILLIFHSSVKTQAKNEDIGSDEMSEEDSDDDRDRKQFSRISVFIEFRDLDHFQRWDLALYMNYKLFKAIDAIYQNKKLFTLEQNHKQINEGPKTEHEEPRHRQDQQMLLFLSNNTSLESQANKDLFSQGDNEYKRILKEYMIKKEQFQKTQKELKMKTLEKINQEKSRRKIVAQNQNQSLIGQNEKERAIEKSITSHRQSKRSQKIESRVSGRSKANNLEENPHPQEIEGGPLNQNYVKISYDDKKRASKQRESANQQRMSKKSNDELFSKWKKEKKQVNSKEEEGKNIKQEVDQQEKAIEEDPSKKQEQNTLKNIQATQKKEQKIQEQKEIDEEQLKQRQKREQIEQQKQRQLQLAKQEEERRKIKQLEEQIRIQKENQQKKRDQEILQWLRSGLIMTKYSKGGFSPHEKRVYLNEPNLCWRDPKSTDFKFIPLQEIQSVNQGQIGPGIKKHLSQKQRSKKGCFMVIHYKNKDDKTLQFGARNQTMVTQFSRKLNRALQVLGYQH